MYTILALSTTITDYYTANATKTVGQTDIFLSANEKASSPLISMNSIKITKETEDKLAYVIPLLQGYGYYDLDSIANPMRITGMQLKDFSTIFKSTLTENSSKPFTGNQLLIGTYTAEKLKLNEGDTFTFVLNNQSIEFTVYAVVSDNNLLSSNDQMQSAVIPTETMEKLLASEGQATVVHIGTNEVGSQKENEANQRQLMEELTLENPHLFIEKAVNADDLGQMLTMIQVSLSLMTMSVILISCFIIYSSFKIIMLERMEFIGTIRSLGATRSVSRKVLYIESLSYGVIGGIFGIALGLGMLQFTISQVFSIVDQSNVKTQLFYPEFAALSFFAALLLVVISCTLPILQVAKKSVKGLLFSEIKNTKHVSMTKSLVGVILIVAGFLMVNISIKDLQMPFSFLGLLCVTVGAALMIPTLTILLAKPVDLIMGKLFGYHVKAAVTQISNDKTLMNTIILLSMGLGIILMINNFSSNVARLVIDVYGKGQADIVMMYYPFEKEFIDTVNSTQGVTHTYVTQDLFDVKANNGTVELNILEGIDGKDFSTYAWNEFGDIFTDEMQKTFESERTLIITTLTANNNNLKVNDTVLIDFDGHEVSYRVLTIVPSIMNNGTMSFIHQDFFVEDNQGEKYMAMYINTDEDVETVITRIKKQAPLAMYPFQSLEAMKQANIKSNHSLFSMMKAISLIAMLIGSIGIFNNYVISFMSRRKFIASLRSLGVAQVSIMKLFLIEALISGIIGSMGGLTVGYVLIEIMKGILENMNIASQMISHSMNEMVFIGVSGIVLGIVGAIIPAISNMSRPIIPELKYE